MPTIATLMTRDPLFVREHTPLAECATHFDTWPIRHLPVVDEHGAVVGMLARHEVFGRGRLDLDGHWIPYDPADRWLRAKDLAEKNALLALPDVDARHVLDRLAHRSGDSVVVVDEERHPLGILTEHDAARLAGDLLDEGETTRSLPTRPLVTVDRFEPASRALELMAEHGIRHLLVTTGDELFGVLSYRDVDPAYVRERDPLVEDLLVATAPVFRSEHMSLSEAAQLMAKCLIGCVPIVGHNMKPLQVVTRTDVLEALVPVLKAHTAAA